MLGTVGTSTLLVKDQRNRKTYPSAMPHSTSADASNTPMDEDSVLPDAPPAALEASDSDHVENVEEDPTKENVKLEDLFDDDDDEEFPSSGVSGETPSSSPPAASPP